MGAGNDTATVYVYKNASIVYGDAGNDTLSGRIKPGAELTLAGGHGNIVADFVSGTDTIDLTVTGFGFDALFIQAVDADHDGAVDDVGIYFGGGEVFLPDMAVTDIKQADFIL